MNTILKTISIFAFIVVSYAQAVETITIRVAHWPPNYFQTAEGEWTGIDVEIAKAVVQKADLNVEFSEITWPGAMERLKLGNIQLITNVSINEERSEYLYWIGPVRTVSMNLIVKKGNESLPINSLDDIIKIAKEKNIKFGYQKQIDYGEQFARRMKGDPLFFSCFERINNAELNLKKTLKGRILGFFESANEMKYRIKNDEVYQDLAVHPFVLKKSPSFFGISKKGVSTETLIKLFKAYESLVKDGTIQRIRAEWENKF